MLKRHCPGQPCGLQCWCFLSSSFWVGYWIRENLCKPSVWITSCDDIVIRSSKWAAVVTCAAIPVSELLDHSWLWLFLGVILRSANSPELPVLNFAQLGSSGVEIREPTDRHVAFRQHLTSEDLVTCIPFNFFYLPCPFSVLASAATLINIRNARKHFEKLERVDGPKHSLLMRWMLAKAHGLCGEKKWIGTTYF